MFECHVMRDAHGQGLSFERWSNTRILLNAHSELFSLIQTEGKGFPFYNKINQRIYKAKIQQYFSALFFLNELLVPNSD